ncbi:MAG: peptidylprolyl isomerase [Chloroflexota bacterium]
MMWRGVVVLMLSLLWVGIVGAQDATPDPNEVACESPFVRVDALGEDVSIVSVNDAYFPSGRFGARMQFGFAYQLLQYEIRIAQLENAAESSGTDIGTLLASDTQLASMRLSLETPIILAERILTEISEEAVVWAYAEANGLTITQVDVTDAQNQFFSIGEDIAVEERDSTIAQFNGRLVSDTVSQADVDAFYCRLAVNNVVRTALFGMGEEALYVDTAHILLSSEETANDIIALLSDEDESDTFAGYATDLSLDTASAARGGELGWQPVVFFVLEYADAVREAEIGLLTTPVQTQFGWHVIMLNGRETRAVEGSQRELILSTQFTNWRTEQLATMTVIRSDNWQTFLPALPSVLFQ